VKHPGKAIEVFATDEHRIGLKPVTRRVWAPIGERPIAPGHHRFDWLYVTAFVSPATGETFWYLSNGVSKEFFEALLATFAREAEAGLSRIILLVLDNAGWHGTANARLPLRTAAALPRCLSAQCPAIASMATLQDPVTNVTPHRKPPGLASIMVIRLPDEQFSLPPIQDAQPVRRHGLALSQPA